MKKRLFAGLLALCMVFNVMPATAFAEEATTEPVATEVVCEAKEDCAAGTHIETCAKYQSPVVVCEAKEGCAAGTHIEGCPANVEYVKCPEEGCELAEGHDGEHTGAAIYEETSGIDTEEELAAAIIAGGTVVLADNIEINGTLTVPAGEEVILDLNGKTISHSKECTKSYEMILNKGNLTITGDGKISFTDTSAGDPNFGWGSYTIRNEGTLVVENGTIEHLGAQNFATHMICAIFQYSGSSTIKGGSISTPNYRSARLWKGDMTIEGGNFDGQLWVQAVDDTSNLVIKGGSFGPNGRDGSSVFVTNENYDVKFAVSGGNFETKIGCSNAAALAGSITGGIFTEAAVNNTNSALLGNGLEFAKTGENSYEVKEKVYVAVNTKTGVEYSTLAEAAAAGGSIKLLENIELNEAVKMNTTVELDLNGKTITGTDTTNANFGLITVNKGDLTITDSVGNGKITVKATVNSGWNRYSAVIANNQGTVTVKSGTIEHLGGTDMAYAIDNLTNGGIGAATLTIEGGTIISPYRAIRQFANSATHTNTLIVTGGTITGANKGIWLQSSNANANKAELIISGGSVSSVYIWTPEGGNVTGLELSAKQGAVTNDTFVDGLGDHSYLIELVGDTYQITKIKVAEANGVKYETLQEAIDAAKAGDTVRLLEDIVLDGMVTVSADDKITLDLNGKTITGTDTTSKNFGLITVNKGNFTVKDSVGGGKITVKATVNSGWNRYSAVIANNQGTVTVKSGTIEHLGGTDMAYAIDNLTNSGIGAATLTIEGGNIVSPYRAIRQFANCTKELNKLEVKGGTITGANKGIWLQSSNANANKAELVISAGTISSVFVSAPENADTTALSVTISGGHFSAGKEAVVIKDVIMNIKGFISGGYFVEKPASEQIADGLVANLETNVIDDVTYLYVIGEKIQGEPELAVTPAEPKVEANVDMSGLTTEATQKVEEAIKQITNPAPDKGTTTFESTLPEASDVATEMNVNNHTEALNSLNEVLENNGSTTVDDVEDVTIHIRPYLDVKVKDVEIPATGSTDAPEVTLNIEMKYDVVASTESDAEDIVTANDVEEGEEKQINSVVTKSGETLDVEKGTEVEITIPLPEIFRDNDIIVVKHIKDDGTVYYYEATVNEDGTITFVNPNGFSTFIITTDNRTATVDFNTSDSTVESVSYTVRDITSKSLPTAEKEGYTFKGWNFAGIDGTYAGALTEDLLDKLSEEFTDNGGNAIVATPVFVEIPAPAPSSGGSSSKDSIAEEVKTEKPVRTDSVGKETVEDGKDELGALIGDSYGLFRLALSVKLKGELNETTDIRIKVKDASVYDDVIILQKTENGWKIVPSHAEDGYVVGKFTSLSEILIFLNPNGLRDTPRPSSVHPAPQSVTPAGTTPAATGDSADIVGCIAAIVVAAVGFTVLYLRKRRA